MTSENVAAVLANAERLRKIKEEQERLIQQQQQQQEQQQQTIIQQQEQQQAATQDVKLKADWKWTADGGWTYQGKPMPYGPTTTPGVRYDPATDPVLKNAAAVDQAEQLLKANADPNAVIASGLPETHTPVEEEIFKVRPYDPALYGVGIDQKQKWAEQHGIDYNPQTDLSQNYTQVQTGEYIPNTYISELQQWVESQGGKWSTFEETLRKGGTSGLSALIGTVIEHDTAKAIKAATENNPELWEAYKSGGIEEYNQRVKEMEADFRENLKEYDTDLYDTYVNEGFDAYSEALKKKLNEDKHRQFGYEFDFGENRLLSEMETQRRIAEALENIESRSVTPGELQDAYRELKKFEADLLERAFAERMTAEEEREILENSPQYKRYTELKRIADETPNRYQQQIYDTAREALSLGDAQTPTFNVRDVEQQYENQKAIDLYTYMGNDKKLNELYQSGAFGKGEYADEWYNLAVSAIQQQKELKKAVNAGDLKKLEELYHDGAFGENLIESNANYQTIVEYVQQGGRELSPITAYDVKEYSDSYIPRDKYVQGVMDTQASLADLSKEMGIALVPVYGTIHNWDKMGGGMKALSIAGDVLSLIPLVGAAVQGSRSGAVAASRAAMLGGAAKAVGREIVSQFTAPATMVLHPVQTAKAAGRQMLNLAENITGYSLVGGRLSRKVPYMVLTTTENTVRLPVSAMNNPAETMAARDMIMRAIARGERPVVEIGGKRIELAVSPFMKEARKAGGAVAHATPAGEAFEAPLQVAYKTGRPAREQGIFFSPEPATRFSQQAAAGGVEATQPTIYIASQETAQEMISSGKLWRNTAEFEDVLPVDKFMRGSKQRLVTRIGPNAEAVTIYLEKPLSNWQLTKLRGLALVEGIKAPFKMPLKIKGLNADETAELSRVLRQSGNVDQADNLITAQRTIARSGSGARVATGRVSADTAEIPRSEIDAARERLEKISAHSEPETPEITRATDVPEISRTLVETPELRTETIETPERIDPRQRSTDRPDPRRVVEEPADTKSRTEIPERTDPRQRTVDRPEPRQPEIDRLPPRSETGRTEPRTPPVVRQPERGIPERPPERRPPDTPPVRPLERTTDIQRTTPPPRGKFSTFKGSDSEKRERISRSKGFTTQNMGKLHNKDVWHVWTDEGEHIVVLGDAPKGARIDADGEGSAYQTTQRVGSRPNFAPIIRQHGAVRTQIHPSRVPKGAHASFSASSIGNSEKFGRMFRTPLGGTTGYSRRPIKRRKKK